MSWTQAARLPLALLTPDMRIRKVIDNAFEQNGVTVRPRVETEIISRDLCRVAPAARNGAGQGASQLERGNQSDRELAD
jgi:hypothetical protein